MRRIVPDIHADPIRLDRCLAINDGSKTAFLGDFIDAGKGVEVVDDEAVLIKVKRLLHERAFVYIPSLSEISKTT